MIIVTFKILLKMGFEKRHGRLESNIEDLAISKNTKKVFEKK